MNSAKVISISDLRPVEVAKRLGLSRSYAHELIKDGKTPSLDVAVRIEAEFGVPAGAWIERKGDQAHGEAA